MANSIFGDKPKALLVVILLWAIGGFFYFSFESQVFLTYLSDPAKTAELSTIAITVILGAETCLGITMITASVGLWFKKHWAKKLAIISPMLLSALLVTYIIIWVNVHLQAGIQLFRLDYWNIYQIWSFSIPHTALAFAYSLIGILAFRKTSLNDYFADKDIN